MYTGFLHLHSTTGIITLILVAIAAIYFVYGRFSKATFTKGSKMIGLFAMIFAHIQLAAGLTLYFISPITQNAMSNFGEAMKNADLRFWAVEHLSTMIIAIVLITIGYSTSKRATTDASKFQKASLFYSLGLVALLLRFPWERIF